MIRADVYHVWIHWKCRAFETMYAWYNNSELQFSNICKYFIIDIMIEKKGGYLPVSDKTAIFEACLLASNMYLRNLICDLSAMFLPIFFPTRTHYFSCIGMCMFWKYPTYISEAYRQNNMFN